MNLKKIGRNVILAICDAEILGKTLCEGKIVFHVKEEFYKGAKVNIDEAIKSVALPTAAPAQGAAPAAEAKKEQKEDTAKSEEAAAEGLGALFG